jgi:beta-glucosidase
VIVYSGGNGLAMPWLSQVKALVFAFLPGQEGGVALANILSGRVNPSGRLPFTIEKSFAQSPAYDYNKMPDGHYYWGGGKPDGKKMAEKFGKVEIDYKEGIYIGYRWYDKKNITPQFPFGYGLSYSPFQFSKIRVSSRTISKNAPVTIRFTVKNTGKMDGAEVAQLYICPPSGVVDRPVKELKGFKKVFLKAGARQTIRLTVKLEDLAYWSPQTHQWEVDHGKYVLALGKSSRDILSHVLITY